MIKRIGLFTGPILFIIIQSTQLSGLGEDINAVIAIVAWMVTWWVTEAVNISVTALLPIILLPLTGIFTMAQATAPYASPVIFLFMGGFMIGLAMQKSRLHERIALHLIRITGSHANGIILGFMIATAVLSMWISNTATAVMMLPVAVSVIGLIKEQQATLEESPGYQRFALTLMLGIAYAANIGGTATIVGTPPNAVLVGYMQEFYQYDVTFSRWLLIGLPISLLLLALTFLMLTRAVYPNGLGYLANTRDLVTSKIQLLGKPSPAERRVMVIFFLTALAWIIRQPLNNLLDTTLNDTIIAMIGGIAMFIVPVNLKKRQFIMDWEDTKDLPWGILILFGGGISIARSMEAVGIVEMVGNNISQQENMTLWILVLVLIALVIFTTELMSNVALVTILLPVVMGIADGLGVAPMHLSIPVTLAASCAFMMPISTPPNAIVFSSGLIKMKYMMKAGIVLNVISIIILYFAFETLIKWVY